MTGRWWLHTLTVFYKLLLISLFCLSFWGLHASFVQKISFMLLLLKFRWRKVYRLIINECTKLWTFGIHVKRFYCVKTNNRKKVVQSYLIKYQLSNIACSVGVSDGKWGEKMIAMLISLRTSNYVISRWGEGMQRIF